MPQKWGILDTPEEVGRKAAEAAAEGRRLRKALFATSAGVLFTAYDFFLFGVLAPVIATQFFSGMDASNAFLFPLLVFAAGVVMRPLGALFFGSLGDRCGRRKAFVSSLFLLGFSTLAIGLLPAYASLGIVSPALLVGFRLLQGLACGGAYPGAVINMAEHAPKGRRGLYAGLVQSAAGFGLFLALLVTFLVRHAVEEESFQAWGWRIPFLLSLPLLLLSFIVRKHLEDPVLFRKMQAQGRATASPLRETFGQGMTLRLVLVVLFGLMSLQGVLVYNAFFYTPFFLAEILKVPSAFLDSVMLAMSFAGALLVVFFCWLSDFTGRRKLIMTGAVLSLAAMLPVFHLLGEAANPELMRAREKAPVVVVADPAECSLQFDPFTQNRFLTACDTARSALVNLGIGYTTEAGRPGDASIIRVGDSAFISGVNAVSMSAEQRTAALSGLENDLKRALASAGYPETANPGAMNLQLVCILMFLLVSFSVMVFAPATVMALENFPTRIRYSGFALSYQVGTAWFGALLPAIAFTVMVATGNLYSGLWYPMGITVLAILILGSRLEETRQWDLDEVD